MAGRREKSPPAGTDVITKEDEIEEKDT